MPADVLAEVRGLIRTNGAGMVDLLLQKKVLPEAELLSALSAEYGIPFWEALPTDHMNTDFTGLVSIQYLKKQKIVPLDTPQGFVVAVNDPVEFSGGGRPLPPPRPAGAAGGPCDPGGDPGGDQPCLRPQPEHGQGVFPGDARRVDGQPHLRDRGDGRPPRRDERRPDHQAGQPPPLRGDEGPGERYPYRALPGHREGPLPDRRHPLRHPEPSQEDPIAAGVACEDHGEAEHRRKAAPPGRPDRDQGRRPERRYPRLHHPDGLRRTGCPAPPGQDLVDPRCFPTSGWTAGRSPFSIG